MIMRGFGLLCLLVALLPSAASRAQPLGQPDRGEPGDAMIQAYLARQTEAIEQRPWLEGIETAAQWREACKSYQREYLYMLGLDPLPERTPLKAVVTGIVEADGYVVEKLHYQSVPGLYVTGNLYRPARIEPGQRLPAIFYVCGHSGMGRDGNKTAYQSHGIWFGRHGYVCLVVDTLQLGEIGAVHHGTYRENRWWWHSRGYTPAGVECWNGVRGIDYLCGRPDVDPERIGVTGISGGGAATFWIAAADERVKTAVPVSGMADLASYVPNRTVNGHCDCMFLYNTFQWPWTRIAGLIAPRPMLFMNSDHDAIFPMDSNERIINRLERLYSRFGAGDRVDSVVSMGGHAYRRDLRESAYRFLNTYLKNDSSPITDSEVDIVSEAGRARKYPIEPERLRVFSGEADLPRDQRNTTIDESFVPRAQVSLPPQGGFESWKTRLLAELRRVSFRPMPDRVAPARPVGEPAKGLLNLATEEGIVVPLRLPSDGTNRDKAGRVVLVVADASEDADEAVSGVARPGDVVYGLQPRGVGATRWTRKSPPNHVARALVLLGRTVDQGRIQDVAATARYLRSIHGESVPIVAAGRKGAGVVSAYAALIEPTIGEVIALEPPSSHMDSTAPQLLNVLRVADVPEALGMLAPRLLTLRTSDKAFAERVSAIYERAGAAKQLTTP